jgi:hypothetical protein
MRISTTRRRLMIGLGWPILLGISTISTIHFLRYRMGVEIYWSWSVSMVGLALAAAILPLLVHEVRIRNVVRSLGPALGVDEARTGRALPLGPRRWRRSSAA